jgi:lipid-A-disaccharide synthase
MDVFVVAGEPSGDRQGAALADEIRRLEPQARISGIGSHAMAAAGVDLLCDSAGWAAIGAGEALKKIPALWFRKRAIVRRLLSRPPALLVLIDFGAFNLRLARSLQGSGIPILYYFPPRSWSRRPPTGDLTDLVDAIATPFRWSEQALAGGRAEVRWVGHPLVDQVRPALTRDVARRKWEIAPDERVLAVVPGSRSQELRLVMPELADAAGTLIRETPGLRVAVTAAPGVDREALRRRFQSAGIEPIMAEGLHPDLLQVADVALACSGTATLELAILGVPMVVAYKVSLTTRLQYEIVRRLRGTLWRFIAMPNVIADRGIVPELLQERARADLIAAEGRALLRDPEARERMRSELLAVAAELGAPGAAARAAEMALALARRRLSDHESDAISVRP